jgi:DNA-binding NtrC family response regulator
MKEILYPSLPLLIVDDEKPWLQSFSFTLEYSEGINHVIHCQDSREVMGILSRQKVSVILLDLTMPHLSGEELLSMIVQNYPEIPVIIITGMNQVETAVECMKSGAFDYFVKTAERERLIAGIRRVLSHLELQRECRDLKTRFLYDKLENPDAFSEIVTRNRKMHSLFRYIEAVASSSEPILITGESGVGKELVARAIQKISRPNDPWVAVNAAGLDDNVFSDTLFGHTKGAFTGAEQVRSGMIDQASSGTLFLDEIGDLSPVSQVKLLRLLQEGEFFPLGSDKPKRINARLVFATNQDLETKQSSGKFRKDLYYRLCAHHVYIPPLRERLEDIPLLLDFYLEEAAQSLGKKKPTPPKELSILLSTYHFPGNVRELRAMVYNAVSVHQAGKLSMDLFKKATGKSNHVEGAASNDAKRITPNRDLSFHFSDTLPTLGEAANLLVVEAMKRSNGNQTIAARLLGISQPALSKRLKKLNW